MLLWGRLNKGKPMKKNLVLLPVALLALAACDCEKKCPDASKKDIASLFDRWNASLRTLDPKKVAANYASDAVLLPTVSNKPRLTDQDRIDYFTDFLKSKPQGVIDSRTIKIDCDTAIDAGVYTFTFGDGSKVQARYTYTYEWNGKDWKISTHHSSAIPE
jgi:uncharacterized protein (TIGR02246 family)